MVDERCLKTMATTTAAAALTTHHGYEHSVQRGRIDGHNAGSAMGRSCRDGACASLRGGRSRAEIAVSRHAAERRRCPARRAAPDLSTAELSMLKLPIA